MLTDNSIIVGRKKDHVEFGFTRMLSSSMSLLMHALLFKKMCRYLMEW
jgi:hypothetical protein